MKTVFLRALESSEKASTLLAAIRGPKTALGRQRFEIDVASFCSVPRSPFAYWISDRLRRVFAELPPFRSDQRQAKHGASTLDDPRFVRNWFEVPNDRVRWVPFAKGGSNSPFYADVHLVLRWSDNGAELKANASAVRSRNGWGDQWTAVLNGYSYYFRPGLTWPHRSATLSAAPLPSGCVFSQSGKAAFVPDSIMGAMLALFNSSVMTILARVQSDAVRIKFEVGLIERLPFPEISESEALALDTLARRAWYLKRNLDSRLETSHAFAGPALLREQGETLAERANAWGERVRESEREQSAIQRDIDRRSFALYGLDESDQRSSLDGFASALNEEVDAVDDDMDDQADSDDETTNNLDAVLLAAELVGWAVGVAFGRFDIRIATDNAPDLPTETDPFDSLPCAPQRCSRRSISCPWLYLPPAIQLPIPTTAFL